MKPVFSIILLVLTLGSAAQELNIGFNTGTDISGGRTGILLVGPTFEYIPDAAKFSINTAATYWNSNDQSTLIFPVYIKVFFGDKFRIGPTAGGFVKANSHYGWLLGINIDYSLMNKIRVFANSEFFNEYWKLDTPEKYTDIGNVGTFTIRLGVKYNILQ